MGLLDTVRTKLTTDGVVDGSTWKCFIGYAPDDQDQIVQLTPSGGLPQDTLGNETVRDTFQVLVRAGELEYGTCETQWWAMFNSLQDADLGASDVYYLQALSSAPAFYLDENRRPNMTANFQARRAAP
jgi:hypothetical protein